MEAQQCVKLTGTNRSIGLIALIINVHPSWTIEETRLACPIRRQRRLRLAKSASQNTMCSIAFCLSPAWWLWRSVHTRSHLELGRKSLQRQWYFVLRRGRVGRCQACKRQKTCPRKVADFRTTASTENNPSFTIPTQNPPYQKWNGGFCASSRRAPLTLNPQRRDQADDLEHHHHRHLRRDLVRAVLGRHQADDIAADDVQARSSPAADASPRGSRSPPKPGSRLETPGATDGSRQSRSKVM